MWFRELRKEAGGWGGGGGDVIQTPRGLLAAADRPRRGLVRADAAAGRTIRNRPRPQSPAPRGRRPASAARRAAGAARKAGPASTRKRSRPAVGIGQSPRTRPAVEIDQQVGGSDARRACEPRRRHGPRARRRVRAGGRRGGGGPSHRSRASRRSGANRPMRAHCRADAGWWAVRSAVSPNRTQPGAESRALVFVDGRARAPAAALKGARAGVRRARAPAAALGSADELARVIKRRNRPGRAVGPQAHMPGPTGPCLPPAAGLGGAWEARAARATAARARAPRGEAGRCGFPIAQGREEEQRFASGGGEGKRARD